MASRVPQRLSVEALDAFEDGERVELIDGYLIAVTAEPGERARLEPFDAIELEVARLFGDIDAGP